MKSAQAWVVLLVVLCVHDVFPAAIPDEGEAAQVRPAPAAPAAVNGNKKVARRQQQKKAAAVKNETLVEGAPAKGQRQQRKSQKKGLKGKQQLKVRKGKINQNKQPVNPNREEVSNKRNKNQFSKTPVAKLDRNLLPPSGLISDDDTYIDYGQPQIPPAPGNRFVKLPNFAAHQKPSDSAINSKQDNVGNMRPLLPNFVQKFSPGVSGSGSSLDGSNVKKPALNPVGISMQKSYPIRSDDMRPILVKEGPDFYQPNPDSTDGKAGLMEGGERETSVVSR